MDWLVKRSANRRWITIAVVTGTILSFCVASPHAQAEGEGSEPGVPDVGDWEIGLSVAGGVHMQRFAVRSRSRIAREDGSSTLSIPTLNIEGQLRTPGISLPNGSLRPLVRAGFVLPANTETTVLSISKDVPPNPRTRYQADTNVSVEWDYGWFVGAGASWDIPVSFGTLRISPSVEYMRFEIGYSGEIKQTPVFPNPDAPISIAASEGQTQDMVGPALSIDAGFAPIGDFTFTAFVQGAYYQLLSDSFDRVSTSGIATDGRPATANFFFEPDDDIAEVRFGLTVNWH